MFRAHYKDSEEWKPVGSEEYNPALHGDILRCGDPECSAELLPVACQSGHAGSAKMRRHFRSKDIDQHRVNCDAFRPSATVDSLSVSLVEATAQRFPIVMNFNFDLGDPAFASTSVSAARRQDTPYNEFREQNKYAYARDSIRGIEEYFKFVAKIQRKYPASMPDLKVAHCGKIQDHDHFAIHDDRDFQDMLRRAYKAAGERGKKWGNVSGLPKAFPFIPSDKTKGSLECLRQTVRSTRHLLKQEDKKVLYLLNDVEVPDCNTAYRMASQDQTDVIAIPRINMGSMRKVFHNYNNSEVGAFFLPIRWSIVSEKQIASAPPPQPLTAAAE